MPESARRCRVFATCDIGQDAIDLLRARGSEVEVYPGPEAAPQEPDRRKSTLRD